MLELVAARLIAPTLGVSLYTWTSVIGVVLGGVSLGNYIGGRLADRRPNASTLAIVYVAASAASLLVLGVLHFVGSLELPRSTPALLQVLWVTAVLFLLPSTILGMPTPLLTRLTLRSVEEGGRVVGRIQASAALGSIVGTFLTGFFLISWFGTREIVVGVAAILLLLAMLARPPWLLARVYGLGSLAVVILATGGYSHSPCTRESAYYCIRVSPGTLTFDVNGRKESVTPPVQTLYLDHLQASVVDVTRPTEALYGYPALYAKLIDALYPPGSRLDSFVIGGGGYVVPRWLEAHYGGRVTVDEIDPEVTRVAEEYLGLKPSRRMTILARDGRQALASYPASTFGAVFGDAFDDYEVPFQLTTREFAQLVSDRLNPNGVFLMDVVDGVHYDFLRSEIRTLREVFPYVGLISQDGAWPPDGTRHLYAIVAAKTVPKRPLPVVSQRSLDAFVANGHSVVLTDDYAPVDELLAPVFSQLLTTGR